MTEWQDEYLTMVDDCQRRETRLDEWEQEFIASIKRQLKAGRTLSAKQIEKLDEVWEKATERG